MSLKATPAIVPMVALLGLLMVKVSVETSPAPTVAGANTLAMEGGKVDCTVNVLLAVSPVAVTPLLIVVTAEVTLS